VRENVELRLLRGIWRRVGACWALSSVKLILPEVVGGVVINIHDMLDKPRLGDNFTQRLTLVVNLMKGSQNNPQIPTVKNSVMRHPDKFSWRLFLDDSVGVKPSAIAHLHVLAYILRVLL
jgi:hypothetical protein